MAYKFDLNSLRDDCWKFAIEMELWRGNSQIARKIWKDLWHEEHEIGSHLECWYRIEETTVRSDNFKDKFELFNRMCTRDKATIWTDWCIAWWCHCHMFFKREYDPVFTLENLRSVAKYCYRIPFYLRSNSLWVIIRYRWYDDSFVSDERADIRDQRNRKWSIEMRFNEQVHWANLYFYLFVFDRLFWSLSSDKPEIYFNTGRGNILSSCRYELYRWNDMYGNSIESIWVMNWEIYDIDYHFRKDINGNFPAYVNNILVPIEDIYPAYNWTFYDIEEIVKEFSAFNMWLKVNCLPEHKREVYKYFSQNFRWYPVTWKMWMLRSIPPEDRKNWSWMLYKLYWPTEWTPRRVMWRYAKKDWTFEQYNKMVTVYDKMAERVWRNTYIHDWSRVKDNFHFKYINKEQNVENW